jgi:hypothetical protein
LCDATKFNTKLRNRHFDDDKLPNRRYSPLKHGLVTRVRDWPYSSFHLDVRAGLFALEWGGDVDTNDDDFGDRR